MNILPGTFDHNRPTMAINVGTGERRIVNVVPWSENARYYIDNEGTYYSAQDCRDIGRGHWILVNYSEDETPMEEELYARYTTALRAQEDAYKVWADAKPGDIVKAQMDYDRARAAVVRAREAYERSIKNADL